MLWVGLTGGIASGKSTVARMLAAKGYTVVSADGLAHDVIAKGTEGAARVRAEFGSDVMAADGSVDRSELGSVVFSNPSLRRKLEEIIHPAVRKRAEEIRLECETRGEKLAFYEIPLLFEKKLESHYDRIITVTVESSIQLARLMARTGLSKAEAVKRIGAQLSQDLKIKGADFVIRNDGSESELAVEVDRVTSALLTNQTPRRSSN